MKNFALFKYSARELLGDDSDGDAPIYENDLLIHINGSMSTVHQRISRSQARAIMLRIAQDDEIAETLRQRLEEARLNPDGNMPVDGAHPVDPAVTLIEERAIFPVLGPQVHVAVVLHFVAISYDEVQARFA